MKSKLLIVACLVIVLCMALILPLSIVNADYSDIVNDANSIVNFNQILQFSTSSLTWKGLTISHNDYNITITGTSTFTSGDSNVYGFFSNFNVVEGKKYYFSSSSEYWQIFTYGQGSSSTELNKSIFTASSTGSANLTLRPFVQSHISNGSVLNDSFFVYIICLSDMFGIGNEPSLEQCKNLFVADYYMYNTGTAMSFGSVNAYQQALSDITNSYSFNLSVSALGLNSFAYNYQNVTSNFYFNQQYNFWYYENTFGTPLFTTLSSGTKLNIEFNFYAPNSGYQPHLHLAVWYLNNQSDLVNIYIDPQGINYYSDEVNNISFVLPTSVDTLYFNVYDDITQAVDTASNSFVLLFNISAHQFDLNTAITNAFITGQKTIMSSYQVGGDKYQEIWQAGYINGLNAETPYTFANLMSSVVEAPLQAVLSIFNFDFLGYNFRNVITLILTLCIILSIIRLFIGMGASE